MWHLSPLVKRLRGPKLALVYLLISSSPAPAYEEDVHFILTKFLAEKAGAQPVLSRELARFDQFTDDNPATSPWTYSSRRKYHFPKSSQVSDLYKSAGCNLEKIGHALHAEADVFSHSGYSSLIGHLTAGHRPDKTRNAHEVALNMATIKFLTLAKILKCWPEQRKAIISLDPDEFEKDLKPFLTSDVDGIAPTKLQLLVGNDWHRYMKEWDLYQEWINSKADRNQQPGRIDTVAPNGP